MSKQALIGFAMTGLVVLATIYLYNRFSKDGGVSTLGVPKAA